MFDLYTWSTPNGRKVSIMLEECGFEYAVHPINITENEQFAADFLRISPNNKIPAIVNRDDGTSLMESGAILLYLADLGGQFLDPQKRWKTLEWLMWQMGGAGPMLGQAHHFVHFNPDKSDYAKERYGNEANRLYGVLDKRLGESAFMGGDDYSIADIATWPWVARFGWQGVDLNAYENVRRWYLAIAARDAVKRGYAVPNPAEIPLPE
ncbi:MAG: glutathione S-transferase N-terminal domain-containing protein [Gammaproteobacteria bacterium]